MFIYIQSHLFEIKRKKFTTKENKKQRKTMKRNCNLKFSNSRVLKEGSGFVKSYDCWVFINCCGFTIKTKKKINKFRKKKCVALREKREKIINKNH